MKIRGLLTILATFSVATIFTFINRGDLNPTVYAEDQCTTGTTISVIPGITGIGINGIVFVSVENVPPDATAVKILLDGDIIGRAVRDPISNPDTWVMQWDTHYTENGGYSLKAVVRNPGDQVCETVSVSVNINNFPTENRTLNANLDPENLEIVANSNAIFHITTVAGNGSTVDLTQFIHINWEVTGKGSINPQANNEAIYNSGGNNGNATVKAHVHYGGQEITLESDVSVNTINTEEPETTSTDDDQDVINEGQQGSSGPVSGDEEELNIVEPSAAITQVLNADATTNTCITNQLGQDNLTSLISDNRRPSSDEFERFVSCFERQNYVIPSIFSPVSPNKVSNLKVSDSIKILKIRNDKKVNEHSGEEKTTLVLEGSAKPNANVLVYVFSEPLVLATTSDGEGNWSYTLEDPLESGEHEVYVLVDKGNGEYESSGVERFIVGAAGASEENPNGYSLELISEPTIAASNRSVNLFVATTIGIVTFSGTILAAVIFQSIRNKTKKSQAIQANNIEGPDNNSDINNFSDSL